VTRLVTADRVQTYHRIRTRAVPAAPV
jgi:hypothetical protein